MFCILLVFCTLTFMDSNTQWAVWVHAYVEADVVNMMFGNMRKKPEAREKIVGNCIKNLGRPLKSLNASLEGKEYLVGDRFTAADLIVASNILFGGSLVDDFKNMVKDKLPNVAAWLHRCAERDAYIPMGGL